MKKSSFFIMSMILMFMTFTACSNDDEPKQKNDEEIPEEVVDELGDLQRNLTVLNEDGSLKERVYGVSLDESMPDVVSIGVDNFDEACEVFTSLFSDTTIVSDNGTKAQFSTRQGTAELKSVTGDDGHIGTAEFNIDGLKYVDKINFILNSAWPENDASTSICKLGVQYMRKAWTGGGGVSDDDDFDPNEMQTFVCVREYSNGKPALLVGISTQSLYLNWRGHQNYSGKIPAKNNATKISEILRADWDTFKRYFNDNSKDLLQDNREYWIDEGSDYWVDQKRTVINLSTGKMKEYDVHWHKPRHQVLFYDLDSGKM